MQSCSSSSLSLSSHPVLSVAETEAASQLHQHRHHHPQQLDVQESQSTAFIPNSHHPRTHTHTHKTPRQRKTKHPKREATLGNGQRLNLCQAAVSPAACAKTRRFTSKPKNSSASGPGNLNPQLSALQRSELVFQLFSSFQRIRSKGFRLPACL